MVKRSAFLCCLLSSVVIFGAPLQAPALPITFIHGGVGSGTLDGLSFTDAAFTITAFGDTDARVVGYDDSNSIRPDYFFIDHAFASIAIEGVGTADFVTGTRTFARPAAFVDGPGTVGFSRGGAWGSDLFGIGAPELQTWDMLTSIGPVFSELAGLLQWSYMYGPVYTTLGILTFNGESCVPATFEAVLGESPVRPVPEPGTLLLLGTGLAGLGGVAWRSRK